MEKAAKKPTLKIIIFSILGLIAIWILLTVVVPLARGNGLGGYEGAKKELAEAV